jgi:hypothetical protein
MTRMAGFGNGNEPAALLPMDVLPFGIKAFTLSRARQQQEGDNGF